MSDIEDKIRAKAHELWLAEGQPEGRAEDHWNAAEALVLAEAKTPRAPRKPRAAAAKKDAPAKAPVKRAAAKKEAAPKKEAEPKKASSKPDLKVVSDKGAAA